MTICPFCDSPHFSSAFDKVPPTEVTYNAVMSACGKGAKSTAPSRWVVEPEKFDAFSGRIFSKPGVILCYFWCGTSDWLIGMEPKGIIRIIYNLLSQAVLMFTGGCRFASRNASWELVPGFHQLLAINDRLAHDFFEFHSFLNIA